MADFCVQCSIDMFEMDCEDLKDLSNGKKLEPNHGWLCICEGCGHTIVDDAGKCISKYCLKNHGAK